MVVIDDSPLKRLIENTYGVGPTVVEGFMRATNLLVAATTFCVVGYGACGRGVARALRADGATVLVVERDPVKALEAAFDGMRVRELHDALPEADVVITVTGTTGVIGRCRARAAARRRAARERGPLLGDRPGAHSAPARGSPTTSPSTAGSGCSAAARCST